MGLRNNASGGAGKDNVGTNSKKNKNIDIFK